MLVERLNGANGIAKLFCYKPSLLFTTYPMCFELNVAPASKVQLQEIQVQKQMLIGIIRLHSYTVLRYLRIVMHNAILNYCFTLY